MNPLQTRQAEILRWEIDNRNLLNRSVVGNKCVYYRATGIGCAVGRLCPKEVTMALPNTSAVDKVFYDLPEDVQGLGFDFLLELQRLHDREQNWTPHGLSLFGVANASEIAQHFNLTIILPTP